jgi:glycosyltransferase involved in cell wall biosynthesis
MSQQPVQMPNENILRSLVIPVYRNEDNIPDLLDALDHLADQVKGNFEVVFVVDGSPDRSYSLLRDQLHKRNFNSQLLALSRNFGAFAAIRCGLEAARGQYFAVMAADLQEPPQLISEFFTVLESGEADITVGRRTGRSDAWNTKLLSNMFWWIYRKLVQQDIPEGGVDVFGCNLRARNSLLDIVEINSSLIAQLFWIGYKRKMIPYKRRERKHGKSAWSLRRRFNYMLDSIFSYTDFPIILLLWIGLFGIGITVAAAAIIFLAWALGTIDVPGYTPIMLAILFVGSTLLATQGIIGCYIWRAAENAKHRPLAIVKICTVFERQKR